MGSCLELILGVYDYHETQEEMKLLQKPEKKIGYQSKDIFVT